MNIYEIVTNKIIECLNHGVAPWQKSWTSYSNYCTRKAYQGINQLLLTSQMISADKNYSSPYWLTWNQIKDLKGMVRKDEKASIIIYWNQTTIEEEITNDTNEKDVIEKKVSFLRYYNVFNIEQTEGIPEAEFNINKEIVTCEGIILNMKEKAEIRFEGEPAYNPIEDYIRMPEIRNFKSSESFYSVLFHELIHWTGNKKRLNRFNNESLRFGSTSYSKEELVAELGSSFLCHISGIEKEVVENQVSYIDNWLSVLENDKRLIVYAGRLAQKGVNYILGISGEEE